MKPDASTYNPDPQYLRELLDSTGLTRKAQAKLLGVDQRTIRYWLSGERQFPYSVQFTLECLVLDV